MTQLFIAACVLLALLGAHWWWRRFRRVQVGPLAGVVVAVAVVAGRLTFVLAHLDVYGAAPWRVADLADGGFVGAAAVFAALVAATEGTRRSPRLRRPLALTLACAACAAALATVAAPYLATARPGPPAVLLRNLDGAAIDLATFRGRPLVLNLWASWCPPCRREMPLLADAQARHADVQFVFVNQGEEAPQIRRFLRAHDLALRNVLSDRLRQAGVATGSSAMPTTLFFNREGELVVRHVGEIDAPALAAALEAAER